MGSQIGDAMNGQGAAGFVPGVVQNVLAGSGYQNMDAQTRLAHMLITGGLAAAGQPAAAVGARAQFGAENEAGLKMLSSPEFQALPSDQQELLASKYGVNLPRDKQGNIVLPPVEAAAKETMLKAKAGVDDIESAHQNYLAASSAGNPIVTAVTKARWLRATGHPVPPDLAAVEAKYGAQANDMAGFDTKEMTIGGANGPVSKVTERPEQFTAPAPGTGAVPGQPGAAAPPGAPSPGQPPTGEPAADTIPVETHGPGNPAALKQHTGGPPDMFMIDRQDGKGLRPFRLDEGANGEQVYTAMDDKEVKASRDHWNAQLASEQKAYDKALTDQMTAHNAAVSAANSLKPLAASAFEKAADVGDHQTSYWAKQMYDFHAPWNSNTPQQQFQGAARQALAKIAASLKMRPGPRSLDALESSHYKPGDTYETVIGRLDRLKDLPDNELRAMLTEANFTAESAASTVNAPADETAAPMAAHGRPTAAPAAGPTGGMDPDVAAIIRARKKR